MESQQTVQKASRKRKQVQDAITEQGPGEEAGGSGTVKAAKKQRAAPGSSKAEGKQKAIVAVEWPEHFHTLFKVFKALNAVLAFCSSRKNFAITFSVVRSSVESLLKRPLELSQVAELKALLPDVVRFAYVSQLELQIHGENSAKSGRARSPDFSAFVAGPSKTQPVDEDEQVLVLDFQENARTKKNTNETGFTVPVAMTPAQTKKLVEKRNERFAQAVNELLEATSPHDDPVSILRAAARDHIPVDPTFKSDRREEPISVPEPEERPSVSSVIVEVERQSWYRSQVCDRRVFEEKEGQTDELDPPLSKTVQQALGNARGITSLYTHQVAAINALSQGKSVIVSTSTASGKSVIYQVPLLRFLEQDPDSTAMFIYPTKALAQDQRAALEQLLAACPGLEHIKVSTYDGDTPQDMRAGIRETASVIFTNFDMLHFSVLPHEDVWRRFLKNLKLVAVDELHYYSSIFGSHVAYVMRRFRRVCCAVGNRRTRFVSCSATISKPKEHMKSIFGIDDIVEVTEDGAPSGRKEFLVWNPPLKDPEDESSGRMSSMSEATQLMRYLMARGVRVILFCKIRKSCELAMKMLRTELAAQGRSDILSRVMAYRGGYSQQDRRKIEREAFSGNLLGIVATNALELGVDIGVLDAVIMLGFPMGGIASFRQQAGRAGRRARDSLAVFVADALPVDQHYVQNPDELFDKPMEDLFVDLESKIILEAHLQCAGQEMPLSLDDEVYFGPLMKEILETQLVRDKDGWYHTHPKFLPFPSKHITLRGGEEEKYDVIDITQLCKPGGTAHVLEEVETSRALFEIYEGGVFIHQGLTFLVKEVSHDSKTAKVIRTNVNWITEPRDFTNVDAVQTTRIREIRESPIRAYYGRVDLKTVVYGYFKVRNKSIIDVVDLDTPPWDRESTGMWLDVPKRTLDLMKDYGINPAEAIHAAEHAFLNRFALGREVKTECKVPEKEYKASQSQRKRPARLIFYDPTGRGGGVTVKAFDHVSELLHDALQTVETCSCDEGCTACIDSPSCKEGNLVSSKNGALIVLKAILGRPIDTDLLPDYSPELPRTFNTVIEATQVRTADGVAVAVEAA